MSAEVQHKPRKPFSMIREFHMADWFTLGNAISGTGALFSSMTYLQSGDVGRIYVACTRNEQRTAAAGNLMYAGREVECGRNRANPRGANPFDS